MVSLQLTFKIMNSAAGVLKILQYSGQKSCMLAVSLQMNW